MHNLTILLRLRSSFHSYTITRLLLTNLVLAFVRTNATNSVNCAHESDLCNTGTIYGNSVLMIPGEALSFNGTGQHILVSNGPDFSGVNEMTLETWIYPQNIAGTVRTIFSSWNPIQYQITITSGIVQFAVLTENGGQTASSTFAINADEWVHIAGTYDGNKLRVIINGELAGETDLTGTVAPSSGDLYIGRDSAIPAGSFVGMMDEIRMWNRALTACEIHNNMNYAYPSNISGLVLRYSLDQGVAFDDNSTETTVLDGIPPGLLATGTLVNFALNGSSSNWVAPGIVSNNSFAPAYTTPTWYKDVDADGYSAAQSIQCYSPGPGWTLSIPPNGSNDCDDDDNAVWQQVVGWYDFDDDGYNSTGGIICIGNSYPTHYYSSTLGLDCNDNNPSAHSFETWYLDADNDGHYVSVLPSCGSPGPGYNLVGGFFSDCDDSDDSIYESMAGYADSDGDGFTTGSQQWFCTNGTLPAGFLPSSNGNDCDDTNPAIHSLATPIISVSSNVGNIVCPGTEVTFSPIYSGYLGTVTVIWVLNDNPVLFEEIYTTSSLSQGDVVYAVLYSTEPCMPEITVSNQIVMQVASSVTWYHDADGDHYAESSMNSCIYPGVGWTSVEPTGVGIDCNDNNALIYPGATEICFNASDDDCDGFINENCSTAIMGDSPSSAVLTVYSSNMNFPNCYPIIGDASLASDSPESVGFNGSDIWYRFVAQSNAVSITLNSSSMDDAISLYSKTGSVYTLLESENASAGISDFERLNFQGLTPGVMYYISVGATTGFGGVFSLCIQHLMPSGCSYSTPVGGFPLCNSFKAIFRGPTSSGVSYNFSFTGTGGGADGTTSLNGTNGMILLSNPGLALRYGGIYDVEVDVTYNLSNSAGTIETITVNGTPSSVNCSAVTIASQPHVEVSASKRCPNSLIRSGFLPFTKLPNSTLPCGAVSYTYEFTPISSCDDLTSTGSAFEYIRDISSPFLPLAVLPMSPNEQFYSVRIRPNFSYGNGSFGPSHAIRVIPVNAIGTIDENGFNSKSASQNLDLTFENFTNPDDGFIEKINLILYPNPNDGSGFMMYTSGNSNQTLFLQVLNLQGQVVFSNSYQNASNIVSVEPELKLSSGCYAVQLFYEGQWHCVRMIVN